MREFKLSESFIEDYKTKTVNWGPLGEFTYLRCVTEETPVLCADFIWREAGSLKEGDELIAFEEERTKGKTRNLCKAIVTSNKIEKAKVMGIELKNGKILYATPEHRWLVKKSPSSHAIEWVYTKDLVSPNDRTPKVMPIWSETWKADTSYEAGYLAAAFDGEGCLDKTTGICFVQSENEMLIKVEEYLKKLNIVYSKSEKPSYVSKTSFKTGKKMWKLSIYGKRNLMEFIGKIRPQRFIKLMLDNILKDKVTLFHTEFSEIIKVWDAGEKNIAVLSTSSKTHITDGVPSHNTYSRRIEEENRNEAWWETVKRVVEGTFSIQKRHCDSLKLFWNNSKAQKSAQTMYDKIFNFKFLPPGRGLWMMGTKFVEEKGSAALNNCGFVSTEDIETRGSFAFQWTMDALMLGVGIGFDTKGAGKLTIKQPKEDGVFIIPDSREGWVESLSLVLDGFFHGKPLPTFDYSQIRKYGEPIKGFGGVASGPGPLQDLHNSLIKLLSSRIGEKLKSTDIVDIMDMIGVCVVSGNVRRSACLALGDYDDTDYVTMKDYNLHPEELKSHRWASNNSVFAEVGKTDYKKFVNSIALNGEPGIVWLENIRKFSRTIDSIDNKDYLSVGVNPCAEQSLHNAELCCLVETFPSLHDSFEEYKETIKYAYLYAKTVTLIPTHWPETNAVLLKNRRIGLSQTGIIEAFVKHGRRDMLDWCNKLYDYVQSLDKTYSDWFCIPRSIKTTTVKPSGTTALLPGVTPGIHYPHSEFYIRRVRVNANNPLVDIMINAGYEVEDDVYGKVERTKVVSFPVNEKFFDKSKKDASIWEQVKNVVDYQRFWSDNSVSVTITFKQEEVRDIAKVLEAYEDSLKTISFLPLNDSGYAQMPYEEITKEKYEEMVSKITKPDFSSFTQAPIGSKFCDSSSCEI